MEKIRLVMNGKCRFYMGNPLDPTVYMYLPDKYDLEIVQENDFTTLVNTIVAHMEKIYKNKGIIVKPDIQDLIDNIRITNPYYGLFLTHIAAVYLCMEWFECDMDDFDYDYNINLIFKNPLNFDDEIGGIRVKVIDPDTMNYTDIGLHYIPSHKENNEDELRRLKFMTYLLIPSAYYVLITGTPGKE